MEKIEEVDEIVMLAKQISNMSADKTFQKKIQNQRGFESQNKRVEIEVQYLKKNVFPFVNAICI